MYFKFSEESSFSLSYPYLAQLARQTNRKVRVDWVGILFSLRENKMAAGFGTFASNSEHSVIQVFFLVFKVFQKGSVFSSPEFSRHPINIWRN